MFFIVGLVFAVTLVDALATSPAGCSCSCSSGYGQTAQPTRSAIRQCTFNKINDGRNVGEIRTCDFNKLSSNTALRATFQGNIRMVGCADGKCCRRWYITFNGKECSSPAPIDASVYADVSVNLHRPGTLDGFCENIPKGRVVVAISVRDCKHPSHPNGNAHTGWNSVVRLIIEEVPPLQ